MAHELRYLSQQFLTKSSYDTSSIDLKRPKKHGVVNSISQKIEIDALEIVHLHENKVT